MTDKLFEAALGIAAPWYVAGTDFDAQARTLTIRVDFKAGSRFAVPGMDGEHAVQDTGTEHYRHLNFFQHTECSSRCAVPRVRLPDGAVRQIEPALGGQALWVHPAVRGLVLMLCQQMTFAAAARLVGETVTAWSVSASAMELALAQADFSAVQQLAIDETSRARGHDYISLAADAVERRVLAVAEGRSLETVETLCAELAAGGCPPDKSVR